MARDYAATPLLMWQASRAYARYFIVLHIMLTFYLNPCLHNVVWMALYIDLYIHLLLYLCFELLSRSCSFFDHNICAYGYSEVFVVVKGCSVSVESTAMGRDKVSI